jgi:F0F1-type ATP synthase assembly protein I
MFPGSDQKQLARYLAMSQVGAEMVGPIVVGLVVDYYFNCSPWGVLVGAVLGLVGGLAHLIQLSKPQGPQKKPPESA